jgi:hypothetical protein
MKNRHSNRPTNLIGQLLALALVSIVMVGCDEKTGQQEQDVWNGKGPEQQEQDARNRTQQERDRQAERDRQPTPAPTPVTPIGGACGLYGNGPCH